MVGISLWHCLLVTFNESNIFHRQKELRTERKLILYITIDSKFGENVSFLTMTFDIMHNLKSENQRISFVCKMTNYSTASCNGMSKLRTSYCIFCVMNLCIALGNADYFLCHNRTVCSGLEGDVL